MVCILIAFGDRCRKIAKPASYKDLLAKARKEFPNMSSVASLVVMFFPKLTAETVPGVKMLELDETAYGSVKDGEVLFFNVQHPITKEYILPFPDEDPNMPRQSQYHPSDFERMIARSEKNQVNKVSRNSFRPRPRSPQDSSIFSPQVQCAGGDAFGSGWGAASDCFWRSNKLVPNLQECKDAVGLAIGESNGYPDDDSADNSKNDAKLQGAFEALAMNPSAGAVTAPSTTSNAPGTESAQQSDYIGAGTAGVGHGPAQAVEYPAAGYPQSCGWQAPSAHSSSHNIDPYEQQFNYGLPKGQSFQEMSMPGATGPTHLVPLEVREMEVDLMEAKQSKPLRKMKSRAEVEQQRAVFLAFADSILEDIDAADEAKKNKAKENETKENPGHQPGSEDADDAW